MYDLQTINADQLATVTDRLLLHRGAKRRCPGLLRPASPGPRFPLAQVHVRTRRVGLGDTVLASLFMVVVVLSMWW